MILTKRQLKQLKRFLGVAVFAFVFEIAFTPVSLAAYENYRAVARGEQKPYEYGMHGVRPSVDSMEMVLSRDESLMSGSVFEAGAPAALPLEEEPSVVAEHWLTASAYSSTPDQTDDTPFTTAWQTPVRDGVVALNFLPKGTMVRFPDVYGDKVFIVEDRMNVRYPYRVDFWMYTREEALTFGLKYVRMEQLAVRVPRDYVLNHYEPAFPGMK